MNCPPRRLALFLASLLFLWPGYTKPNAMLTEQEKEALAKTLVGAGLNRTANKVAQGERLTHAEHRQVQQTEKERYVEMRHRGQDEVSHTADAAVLRSYRLRNKKRHGIFPRKETSLAQVLFPGVSPNNYRKGELLIILTDLALSKKTTIPYRYYDLPLNCDPPKFINTEKSVLRNISERQSLGSSLQGYTVEPAPYTIHALKDSTCKISCVQTLTSKNIRHLRTLVAREYRIRLSLDQLPVLMRSKEYNRVSRGYPIGFKFPMANAAQKTKRQSHKKLETGKMYLFNHFQFVIHYEPVTDSDEEDAAELIRITGFDVTPISYPHKLQADTQRGSNCEHKHLYNDPRSFLALPEEPPEATRIAMSYEVKFVRSATTWNDRWDVYLIQASFYDIQHFNIVASLLIIFGLTMVVVNIMVRTLREDIALYNELQTLEARDPLTNIMFRTLYKDIVLYNEMQTLKAHDPTGGWKLVHEDVFRPPQSPLLLSLLVGTGAQIGAAFFLALIGSTLHFINPMTKGQFLSAIIYLYVLSGSIAGYVSARFFKFMGGTNWKNNTILTALGLPGCFVVMSMILNIFLSFVGAATAVSFFTIVKLLLLWACVSTPLVLVGSYFGLKQDVFEIPTKINQIARVIPSGPLIGDPRISCWIGGSLPFGSVMLNLRFIMDTFWLHEIYSSMGFLLAAWIILVTICALVSMIHTFFRLSFQDYRWWWPSFWNGATAGVYLFLYSLWYLTRIMDMVGVFPVIVYLTYMGMISICFGMVCGSIGFLASFCFCRKIYVAVKADYGTIRSVTGMLVT